MIPLRSHGMNGAVGPGAGKAAVQGEAGVMAKMCPRLAVTGK